MLQKLPVRRPIRRPSVFDYYKQTDLTIPNKKVNDQIKILPLENVSGSSEKMDSVIYDRDICKICIENEIDCVYIECGHLMSCLKCSESLETCPFCRQTILKILKIYRV
jgi:hypothetical protein